MLMLNQSSKSAYRINDFSHILHQIAYRSRYVCIVSVAAVVRIGEGLDSSIVCLAREQYCTFLSQYGGIRGHWLGRSREGDGAWYDGRSMVPGFPAAFASPCGAHCIRIDGGFEHNTPNGVYGGGALDRRGARCGMSPFQHLEPRASWPAGGV